MSTKRNECMVEFACNMKYAPKCKYYEKPEGAKSQYDCVHRADRYCLCFEAIIEAIEEEYEDKIIRS